MQKPPITVVKSFSPEPDESDSFGDVQKSETLSESVSAHSLSENKVKKQSTPDKQKEKKEKSEKSEYT